MVYSGWNFQEIHIVFGLRKHDLQLHVLHFFQLSALVLSGELLPVS